ncbi:MAG: toxin-antitoxin system YwqK family antitoxin, partial [Polaribacter sp.]
MINIKRLFFVSILLSCFFVSSEFNAQKINQFDKNKKRTGVWKKYYPNKRIRYVGEFKNGKEVGVFKFYDITTSKFPVSLKTFSETTDSVFVQFFTRKGILVSEGYLLGKKRVGTWKYYFSSGKLLSQEEYKNGLLEGELINYYPDGIITEKSNYKNGLLHGISQKYSSRNILIEEVNFKNGEPNGVAKYFELNGNLKETGVYKNGKRVGKWEYYLDGEIAKKKKKPFNSSKG